MTEMICFYRTSFISHVHVILLMMLICITAGGYIFAAFCAFLRGKENGVGDNADRMLHSVGSRGKGPEVVSVSCFEDFPIFLYALSCFDLCLYGVPVYVVSCTKQSWL